MTNQFFDDALQPPEKNGTRPAPAEDAEAAVADGVRRRGGVQKEGGRRAVTANGAGCSSRSVNANAGVKETDASGCGVSLTFCCALSQCFWQRAVAFESRPLEFISGAPAVLAAASHAVNCRGQAYTDSASCANNTATIPSRLTSFRVNRFMRRFSLLTRIDLTATR